MAVKRVSNRNAGAPIGARPEVEEVKATPPIEPVDTPGLVVREQLSTLFAARKRPPSMKMATAIPANEAISGDLSPGGLELLADVRNDMLAYHVADMSLRLNKLDQSTLTEGQQRGVATVNQLTRMFEHLHIMRTSQADL